MKLALSALAFLFLAAWFIERWMAAGEAARRRREADNLRHITGGEPWWKTPPGDPPEGDH